MTGRLKRRKTESGSSVLKIISDGSKEFELEGRSIEDVIASSMKIFDEKYNINPFRNEMHGRKKK